jgi:ABC-type dipeptide/oligopeptide/nickel transport system permease subunit
MKQTLPTIAMLIGLALGAIAGHFHGKAEVYAGMFDQHAMLAEMVNE